MRKINFLLPAVFSCVAMLSGCGSPQGNLQDELNTLTKTVKGHVPPLPVIVPYEAFSYQADKLIDPFAPVKIAAKFRSSGGVTPDATRVKEYLESFPLDNIKMVGSVKIDAVRYAVVQIDGMTYKVRPGSYLGQNFGRVISVTESTITLKEMTQESGEWAEKTSELFLQGTTEGIKK